MSAGASFSQEAAMPSHLLFIMSVLIWTIFYPRGLCCCVHPQHPTQSLQALNNKDLDPPQCGPAYSPCFWSDWSIQQHGFDVIWVKSVLEGFDGFANFPGLPHISKKCGVLPSLC